MKWKKTISMTVNGMRFVVRKKIHILIEFDELAQTMFHTIEECRVPRPHNSICGKDIN